MAGMGTLRLAQLALKNVNMPLARNCLCLIPKPNATFATCVRRMGSHKRTMQIRASKFEWTAWKDHLHFYILLGVVPLTILATSVNVFYGQAELAELPEDREPDHWEYYKSPISRFLARYFWVSLEKTYETHLHVLNMDQKKQELEQLEKKVRHLMATRGDYKGWYYVPAADQRVYDGYAARKIDEKYEGSH